MPLYEPRVKQVEAYQREDGSFIACFDGEWTAMEADEFEGAYVEVSAPARAPRATKPKASNEAKPPKATGGTRKGGRKPKHWRCRCGTVASGQKCAGCGKWKTAATVADADLPTPVAVSAPTAPKPLRVSREPLAAAPDAGWMA